MRVELTINNAWRTWERDMDRARKIVEEILLRFNLRGLPLIQEDHGSKSRLLYETAVSYDGQHRPLQSTSRAVKQIHPHSTGDCYMSLLEIPFIMQNGRKKFHSRFLCESTLIDKINKFGGCQHKVYGADYKMRALYCDPFVLVIGSHWKDVDHAVDALKLEIQKHCDECGCSYLSDKT